MKLYPFDLLLALFIDPVYIDISQFEIEPKVLVNIFSVLAKS
jgi:hypothetical protein